MKKKTKVILSAILALLVICYIAGSCFTPKEKLALEEKAAQAQKYCSSNGMNTNYCVLVDYGRHSGRDRMFVWDFKKDKVVFACPCAHGSGGKSTWRTPEFSNAFGSKCSSLGKYRLAECNRTYKSNKRCIRVDGLESSNSNARNRGIVVHSWVPQYPLFPMYLPMIHNLGPSIGCFVISARARKELYRLKQTEKNKSILLWAYDD